MITKQCTRAAIAVVGAAIALSACSGTTINGKSGQPAPASAKPAESSASPATRSQPDAAPSPDAQQTRALMGALKAIDPALGDNQRWAITAAKTICADIQAGQADADVQQGAQLRFQGDMPGTIKSVSDGQAARIVTAVKSSFCK
ncbi:hypothetical protein [Streptomyces sp. A1-5]|uniref:hypothetical protein n=1 Tax=Streptomyces sp. A1-5 TaxID=2738410 RepID=UPI001F2B24DB|nr:hypothetical protein [Streptomyces sp. A1-5]UJB43630.1 hypothetical protein HRD51_25050 [Streptomyces sp. A1-5]